MAVSSWCRAVGWRLSCYGRQVFSTRVSKHHMFSPLTLVKFFCLESVLVQIFSRLRSNPYWPGLWHLRASPAITGFVPSQTQTLCSYVVWNAVPSHIQSSIKILGVKI